MGFFDPNTIPQRPNLEPPGFDLMRAMLMQRTADTFSNPYGLNEQFMQGGGFGGGGGMGGGGQMGLLQALLGMNRPQFNPYSAGMPGGGGGGGMGGPRPPSGPNSQPMGGGRRPRTKAMYDGQTMYDGGAGGRGYETPTAAPPPGGWQPWMQQYSHIPNVGFDPRTNQMWTGSAWAPNETTRGFEPWQGGGGTGGAYEPYDPYKPRPLAPTPAPGPAPGGPAPGSNPNFIPGTARGMPNQTIRGGQPGMGAGQWGYGAGMFGGGGGASQPPQNANRFMGPIQGAMPENANRFMGPIRGAMQGAMGPRGGPGQAMAPPPGGLQASNRPTMLAPSAGGGMQTQPGLFPGQRPTMPGRPGMPGMMSQMYDGNPMYDGIPLAALMAAFGGY